MSQRGWKLEVELISELNFDSKRDWRVWARVVCSKVDVVSFGLASVVWKYRRNVSKGIQDDSQLTQALGNEHQHRVVPMGIWTGREFEVSEISGEGIPLISTGTCGVKLQRAAEMLFLQCSVLAHLSDGKDGCCFSTQNASFETTVRKLTFTVLRATVSRL